MRTHRGSLALMVMLLAAVATGAAWHWSGPVEPALRNRWRSSEQLPGGMTREDVMDISRSGDVLVERRWRSTGTFETFEQSWRLITSDGSVHAGTWVQPGRGRVRFAGGFPFEPDSWVREVLPQGGGPLAGRWRNADEEPHDLSALIVDADGRYRYARLTVERASLEARGGEWRLASSPGETRSGAYRLEPDGALHVSIGGEEVTWQRD